MTTSTRWPPVVEQEAEGGKVFGERGVEPQDLAPGFDAAVAALDQVDGSGHGTEVDPLVRGAALDVGDVAEERLEDSSHERRRSRRGSTQE
jgi:hypothetical protein